MTVTGSPIRPLRVAIVGSGPSGFFAAGCLQKQQSAIDIDMFDRLPTPFGLVRGGVAPDHPDIKAVVRIFERVASQPGYSFLGNVTIGKDITHDELARHYDAVIYAIGAQADRRLGIAGEDLTGIHSATEFVGWYNGHPDYHDCVFDLSQESVALVGLGNVALDVARILGSSYERLCGTDISPHALEALRASNVKTIYILGRRGPAQAAFTNPEIRELGELTDVDLVVTPEELKLDEASQAEIGRTENPTIVQNLETLAEYAKRHLRRRRKQIVLRFLVSPVAFHGCERVTSMTLTRNRLEPDGRGGLKAVAEGEADTVPVGLVFRSVGYRGLPVPGLPFDDGGAVIPNAAGRVLAGPGLTETLPSVYVVGWIKRGATGVIGTNKADAQESVNLLLQDLRDGKIVSRELPSRETIRQLLEKRGIDVVSYADWRQLDEIELARGKQAGRRRVKFCGVEEMLEIVRQTRTAKRLGEFSQTRTA
jgi:ferredoxin/flavodoxin---NADP+ reductase